MKIVLHKADARGHTDEGWLKAYHTFSFAKYYDSDRMHFGVIRVLNDEVVAPGKGFERHPHDNMEIVSISLEGELDHKDNLGNAGVISAGEVQVMSAGTGLFHSEFNNNTDREVQFLQIWLFPNKKNVLPRYDQITLEEEKLNNQLFQILSPDPEDPGVWIYQNAWFYMGNLNKGFEVTYSLKEKDHGVYVFVIEGDVTVEDTALHKRDGLGIWETDQIRLKADTNARVLLMDVPMER